MGRYRVITWPEMPMNAKKKDNAIDKSAQKGKDCFGHGKG